MPGSPVFATATVELEPGDGTLVSLTATAYGLAYAGRYSGPPEACEEASCDIEDPEEVTRVVFDEEGNEASRSVVPFAKLDDAGAQALWSALQRADLQTH